MMRIGLLTPKNVAQGIVNRFGKCFSITTISPQIPAKSENKGPQIFSTYVENAPPLASSLICTNNDLNNQYRTFVPVPEKSSGICTNSIQKPILTDIKPGNLRSLSQLDALYQQALDRNWFKHSENQVLEFISAAVRAITTPANDPVRVFVSLVRRGLTAHITQTQETRAQEKLSRYRRTHPDAFKPCNFPRVPQAQPPPTKPQTSKSILETVADVLRPLNLLGRLEEKLRMSKAITQFSSGYC